VLEGKSMFIVLASTHKPKVIEAPQRPARIDGDPEAAPAPAAGAAAAPAPPAPPAAPAPAQAAAPAPNNGATGATATPAPPATGD
jgi:2-oxoglutarate dehydrogenase E2 component (dihydrolipoamide succinyltransferase)